MRKGKNSLDSKYGSNQNKRATKSDQDLSIHNILNNTENNELVFYNPNMVVLQKCIISFCEEISKHYDTRNKLVIVSGEPALFDLGIYEEKLNHGNSNKTMLIKTDLQKLPEIYEMIIDEINEFPTSIIFDNINELEDLEIIIKNSHTFKNNFKHVILTTSSPSIFLNVRDKGKNFSPIFYESRKYFDYFRRYKDKIRLIEYKNMSDELYLDSSRNNNAINSKFFTLSQFINDLRMGSISSDMFDGDISVLKSLGDRILFLLLNGVYDSKFVVDIVMKNSKFEFIRKHLEHLEYKSNKLSKFLNLINEESGRELTLVVKKPILIRIICSVLDVHFPNCKMINLEGDGMKISLKKYERTLDLTILGFNEYLSKSNWMSSHVIFFDFVQMGISDRIRVFVCSKGMDFLINQVIKEEELAKTDLVKNENMNVSENTPDSICTTNIDTVKNFDFVKNNDPAKDNDVIIRFVDNSELTSDEIKEISEELNFIIKDVKFTPPTLRLENNRNLSYFGVRLANHLPYAVEVSNLKGNIDGFSTVCESIAFGTLTKHNTFIDPYVIDKNTYLFPKKDVILLYCIRNHDLIKIEIPTDCMEKYIIMDKYGLIIDVYICIGRRPKFYNVDISNTKIDKLKNIIRTKERFEFLEHLQWNRASLNEVPFIENRNDIKIRVNLKFNPDQKKLKSYLKYHKNQEDESKFRKIEIYDIVDMFVSVFTGYPGVKILFSKFLREKPTALSTVQILDQFKNTDFSDYYFVVCLLSQKGRFFNYNLDLEDCVRIKSNVKGMITTLLNRVNTRFMNIKKILENHRDINSHGFNYSHLMRHVIITPLSIIYKLPISFDGNRVLREFDHEKFLRVSLREEDMLSKVKDTSMRNQNNVFDYLRKILFDGIFIGERKYFFLGMTMSQMRLHSTWFVTPYFHKSQLIGPDYIRNWLGDFSEIKNIGKYAIRLGQALSSTNATINIDKYTEVCDIERNGHTFSDGIGLISFSAAKEVSKMLRIDHIPSAFQIRFAGFKGVVCVHPILEQDKVFLKDLNFNDCNKRLMKNLKVNFTGNKKEEDFKRVKFDLLSELSCNLLTRPSMKKFESTHRNIEVVTYASCQPCYLNRQYIMLLEGLGVDISVFLEFHDNYLFSHLSDIYNRPYDYVKRHFGLFSAKFNLQNSKIYKKMITTIFNKHMRDFYKKNKILVKKGCVLMGGLDELGVLKENEVYLRVRKDLIAHNEGFIFEDEYAVVTGPVLIMKNPCLHPGDIRTVNAVNRPELRYMRDVLVFNQKGERPLPNMCSGSDLDGDMYTIIWDSSLLPKKSYAPSEYTGLIVLNKEIVSSSDIVNFYIRYIRNYHLGSIANAHLVQCDENSIDHENSIFLAELFNRSIDFPKTGFMATVPETLMPQRYPDFMESRFNSYPSLKTVGVLFRRGFDSQIVNKIRCECRKCLGVYVEQFPPVFRSIIENSNIKYKEILKNPIISEKSVDLFNNYKKDITGLMDKHGYKKEELAFLNFAEEEGTSEEILIDIKNLFHKYRNIINDTKANLSELLKLSEDCYENINSLPLVFHSSFICKGKIHLKNLNSFKNLDNRFILNSSLVIKYFEGESNEVKSYNKNDVYVERELYENLLKIVNESNQRILKDVFELLFIEKKVNLSQIDSPRKSSVKYLMGKFQNEEIDRLKVCKMMLEISREFFTKAATLPFCHFVNREILSDYKNGERKLIYRASLQTKNNFHIRQKYVDNNEKVKIIIDNLSRIISTTATLLILKINTIEKGFHIYFSGKSFQPLKAIEPKLGRKKVESFSHFIIKGMFDNSDELKLESYKGARKKGHENTPLYVPKLLNKGFCDSDTYKDNFKQFFIDIFLGGLPNLNPKDYHLGILLQIMVTPGRFYFYNVNPLSINTILTVDKLKSKTLFYKGELLDKNALKSYFYNYHLNIFDNDLRQNYISSKGIVFDEKSYEYIFSFVKENVRYQAYYEKEGDNFILIRITKNKKLKGKAFLLEDDTTNLSNDVQFELSYEEIILEGDKNVFDEEEKVFLSGDLFTVKNNNFVVNDLLYGSKQFRFEINTMLNVRNSKTNETYPFTISSREVHTPSKHGLILDSKNTRLAVYSLISKIYKVRKDLNQFIGDFDMVWNCYKAYYG